MTKKTDHQKMVPENPGLPEEVDFDEKRYTFTSDQKEQITTCIKEYLQKRREIRFAFLHGSFLEELPCRDIDIGVCFQKELTPDDIFDLTVDLSLELTLLVRAPVDVHALNQAGNAFCYHVTQGVLLLSRDEEETYTFIEKTWRDYLDFQPLTGQILHDLLA
ncbi:MAG TPA: nucleotidyltransferase domain-containing protein [Desulfotomaculum sp.]|nr:nucleotidyltransferase domain-containing protein [Desulfotomaculum sp.]